MMKTRQFMALYDEKPLFCLQVRKHYFEIYDLKYALKTHFKSELKFDIHKYDDHLEAIPVFVYIPGEEVKQILLKEIYLYE